MITVYYRKVFSNLEDNTFLLLLNKVEKERREKLFHLKGKEVQMRSLTAGCLLHDALCERLGISPEEQGAFEVSYGERGKPFLTDYSDIHYSLSHSGDYVCCALGKEPLGVDIQKKTEVNENIAKRFFTQEDNQRLKKCSKEEWKNLFFRMWSIKESYIKLSGLGMAKELSGFEIDWEKKAIFEKQEKEPAAFFTEQEQLSDYSFCICTKYPGRKVIWKEFNLPRFLPALML